MFQLTDMPTGLMAVLAALEPRAGADQRDQLVERPDESGGDQQASQ
jgi:hypothetical protein